MGSRWGSGWQERRHRLGMVNRQVPLSLLASETVQMLVLTRYSHQRRGRSCLRLARPRLEAAGDITYQVISHRSC